MEDRLQPDPWPREPSRNLNSPLPLLSSKLPFANLCSQAPISSSGSPSICPRISNASSCVPGSVLQCSLSWCCCFVEVVPSVFFVSMDQTGGMASRLLMEGHSTPPCLRYDSSHALGRLPLTG